LRVRFHFYAVDFEHSGGDIVKESLGVNITNYSYYTDKPAADSSTRVTISSTDKQVYEYDCSQ